MYVTDKQDPPFCKYFVHTEYVNQQHISECIIQCSAGTYKAIYCPASSFGPRFSFDIETYKAIYMWLT